MIRKNRKDDSLKETGENDKERYGRKWGYDPENEMEGYDKEDFGRLHDGRYEHGKDRYGRPDDDRNEYGQKEMDLRKEQWEDFTTDTDKKLLSELRTGIRKDMKAVCLECRTADSRKSAGFLKVYATVMTAIALAACVFLAGAVRHRAGEQPVTKKDSGIGAGEAAGLGSTQAQLTQGTESTQDDVPETVQTDKNYFVSDKYSEADIKPLIRQYMTNNEGTLKLLREIFPEEVVVFHENSYRFIPIIGGLKQNTIDNNKIEKDARGELTYVENGKVVSHKGIDVSRFQETIDWDKVKKSGVEYVIVRVGYRGYGTGAMMEDEFAKQNIEGALKAGLQVGVYFFSEATTIEEAVEEAEFVIARIKDYQITYPVYFDTEDIANDAARTDSLSVLERTEIAIAFCEHIRKAGFTPGIYANLKWYTMALDMEKLEEYEKWYAYYDEELYFPYKIDMWQYSENGSVDGIKGGVDMNISFTENE